MAMKAYLLQNPNTKEATQLSFSYEHEKVNHPDFYWEEEGEEFVYNGDKYDVISASVHNHLITFICIKDKNENALEKKLADLQKKSNSQKSPNNRIIKLISQVFISNYQGYNNADTNSKTSTKNNYYQLFFPENYRNVLTPPPDMYLS